MSGRPWTREEDAVLRNNAIRATAADIGALIGRTRDSVKYRAIRIGVALTKYGDAAPNTRYSDALIEQARQMHEGGHGPRYISRELGINEHTLRSALYWVQRKRPAILELAA